MTSWLHPNKPEPVWSLSAVAPLPDEPPRDPSKVQVGGGSLDGIMSVRGGDSDGSEPLAAAAVINLSRSTPPSTREVHAAANAITAYKGPQATDRFLETIRKGGSVSRTRVADIGGWLNEHGVTCQQARAGLGLLGISGRPDDTALIVRLGLIVELTLYAVVALKNLLPEARLPSVPLQG